MYLSFFDDFPRKYLCAIKATISNGWNVALATNCDSNAGRRYKLMTPGSSFRLKNVNPLFIMLEGRARINTFHNDLGGMFNVSSKVIQIFDQCATTGQTGSYVGTIDDVFAMNLGLLACKNMYNGYADPEMGFIIKHSRFDFGKFRL